MGIAMIIRHLLFFVMCRELSKMDKPRQDSSLPDFWNTRYADNTMPWDAGSVPLALQRYLSARQDKGSVLIPGCGSAYEAKYFHQNGWKTLAIDFSELAVKRAQTQLGELAHLVSQGDFFQQDFSAQAFDLIYERTFLCALPRTWWPQYAQRMAQIIPSGKLLAGFYFFHDEAKGPPFGLQNDELNKLLDPYFVLLDDQPVPPQESISIMQNRERWQTWLRK
jgi:protein-L-isoaspartate O-methyltransferase